MSRLATAAALLALVLASGCDDDDAVPAADPEPISHDAGDLWGHEFKSTAITEGGEPRPLVPDTRVTVTFDKSDSRQDIGFSAGCNSAGGPVEVEDQTLRVGRIASTLIGCEPDLARQDEWLFTFFESDPQWELAGDSLTLTSGDTRIELAEAG